MRDESAVDPPYYMFGKGDDKTVREIIDDYEMRNYMKSKEKYEYGETSR